MKRLVLLFLILVPVLGWLYPEFRYRQTYNVSATADTSVPVNISVDTTSFDNCTDARFSHFDGNEVGLSWWFATGCGSQATYWISTVTSANETIQFYYNSTGEPLKSNSSAVFDSPRCFLPFEDSGEVAEDASGDYDGKYVDLASGDLPQIVPGIHGDSVTFDDSGDAVNLSHLSANGLLNFTVELWVNTSQTGHYGLLSAANAGSSDELALMGQGKNLTVYVSSIRSSVEVGMNDSKWHHVAITRSDSNVSIFFDGTYLTYFEPGNAPIQVDHNGLWLGQNQSSVGNFVSGNELEGGLDELRIYNVTMAPSEISKRLNFGTQYDLELNRLLHLESFTGDSIDESVNVSIYRGDSLIQTSQGNITRGFPEETYNISFAKSLSGEGSKVEFKEVSPPLENNVQFNESYEGYLHPQITAVTPILAAKPTGKFAEAEINLPKKGVDVNSIVHCTSWNFSTENCSSWAVGTMDEYGAQENATHVWFTVNSFDAYGGGNSLPDAQVNQILLNVTDPGEKELVKVSANVSNEGVLDMSGLTVWANGTDCNGGEYSIGETSADIAAGDWKFVNFTHQFEICNHTVKITADPSNDLTEDNESNNENTTELTVTLWSYFHGNVSSILAAKDDEDNTFAEWSPSAVSGNVFFVESDDGLIFFDLRALNGTNDFEELDLNLTSENLTDGISEIYDSDGNGEADETGSFTVRGKEITDVPVATTYSGSPWKTGIHWDVNDGGSEYDGSQTPVFVVELKESTTGSFGKNNYEIRVPALLRSRTGSLDMVSAFVEVG